MTIHVEAIYEDGVFRPLGTEDTHLSDGTKVRLTIEQGAGTSQTSILDLAAAVYEGLKKDEVLQIEQIANDGTTSAT